MIVKAVRPFISTQFGNVDPGRVIEMPDAKARFLMDSGLVAEYASPLQKEQSSFQRPVGEVGSSLPADPVSTKETVSESKRGVTYRRRTKSRS
jgi:hypothetical protein